MTHTFDPERFVGDVQVLVKSKGMAKWDYFIKSAMDQQHRHKNISYFLEVVKLVSVEIEVKVKYYS